MRWPWNRRLLEQIASADGNTPATAQLADLQERSRGAEQRTTEVRERTLALSRTVVDQREIAKAMSVFDPVWGSLTPREQARVVQLLVERVDYDASARVRVNSLHHLVSGRRSTLERRARPMRGCRKPREAVIIEGRTHLSDR